MSPGIKDWKREAFHSLSSLLSDPLRKIFASCLHNPKFCWPRNFGSRIESTPARIHDKHPIELEAQISPGHFGLLLPLNQQAKKGLTVLGGVLDPNHHGNWAASLHWR